MSAWIGLMAPAGTPGDVVDILHRELAVALREPEVIKKMGDMVLEDMDLMDRNLPPMRCKRAERETVARMRSKPVSVN